jgi:hypothetical protein
MARSAKRKRSSITGALLNSKTTTTGCGLAPPTIHRTKTILHARPVLVNVAVRFPMAGRLIVLVVFAAPQACAAQTKDAKDTLVIECKIDVPSLILITSDLTFLRAVTAQTDFARMNNAIKNGDPRAKQFAKNAFTSMQACDARLATAKQDAQAELEEHWAAQLPDRKPPKSAIRHGALWRDSVENKQREGAVDESCSHLTESYNRLELAN